MRLQPTCSAALRKRLNRTVRRGALSLLEGDLPVFTELAIFEYHPAQWARFKSGELWAKWARAYPDIFDPQDVEIARNQAGPPNNYHWHEWLAAVLIYHAFGYLSLVEQYEFKIQKRKRAILRELLANAAFSLVTDHVERFGRVQGPDLFVYSPDRSDWFFCEVKGPRDRLREVQIRYFEALVAATGKDIRVVRFKGPKATRPA
jgi:hypothetical protein